MPTRSTPRRLALPALLACCLIAACSGGGSSATPTSAGGGGSPSTAASTPVPGGGGGGGGAKGGAVSKDAPMCGLLGPGDFAAAGVSGATSPKDSTSPGSDYCVYAGRSGATGGIEFDAFVSASAADAQGAFSDSSAELVDPVGHAGAIGADKANLATGLDNGSGGKWAGVAVLKGRLVFDISIPDNAGAEAQLVALSQLVLARGANLI